MKYQATTVVGVLRVFAQAGVASPYSTDGGDPGSVPSPDKPEWGEWYPGVVIDILQSDRPVEEFYDWWAAWASAQGWFTELATGGAAAIGAGAFGSWWWSSVLAWWESLLAAWVAESQVLSYLMGFDTFQLIFTFLSGLVHGVLGTLGIIVSVYVAAVLVGLLLALVALILALLFNSDDEEEGGYVDPYLGVPAWLDSSQLPSWVYRTAALQSASLSQHSSQVAIRDHIRQVQ